MDSLPSSLLNSDPMISLDLPSASKGDNNISMMSSDSCPLDMGDLHSADALDQLHSADAADVTEIIATGLKDVDCSKFDVVEVASMEMERLSLNINENDYNELMEEGRRQKTSISSLTIDDNDKVVEEKSSVNEREMVIMPGAVKANDSKNSEMKKKTDGFVEMDDKSGSKEEERGVVVKENAEGAVYVQRGAVDQDLELDAITEIISISPATVDEKSMMQRSGSGSDKANDNIAVGVGYPSDYDQKTDDRNDVKLSKTPFQVVNDGRSTLEGDARQNNNGTAAVSLHQKGEIELPGTAMHVLECDQDTDEDYEAANSPSGSTASESGLRDRGGSSRNKTSKFASSTGPLRRILPKTAVLTSGTSPNSAGTIDKRPQPPCLESGIPSVVQEAISLGVVTDGPVLHLQESYVMPPPEPTHQLQGRHQHHHQHPNVSSQQAQMIAPNANNNNHIQGIQNPYHFMGNQNHGFMASDATVTTTTMSYPQPQQYTQPLHHHQLLQLQQQQQQQQNGQPTLQGMSSPPQQPNIALHQNQQQQLLLLQQQKQLQLQLQQQQQQQHRQSPSLRMSPSQPQNILPQASQPPTVSQSHNTQLGQPYFTPTPNTLPQGLQLHSNNTTTTTTNDIGALLKNSVLERAQPHLQQQTIPPVPSPQQFIPSNSVHLQYPNQSSVPMMTNQLNQIHNKNENNILLTQHQMLPNHQGVAPPLLSNAPCQNNQGCMEEASFYDRLMSGADNELKVQAALTLGQSGKNRKAPKRLANHQHHPPGSEKAGNSSGAVGVKSNKPIAFSNARSLLASGLLDCNVQIAATSKHLNQSHSETLAKDTNICHGTNYDFLNQEIEARKQRFQSQNANVTSASGTSGNNIDFGMLLNNGPYENNSQRLAGVTGASNGGEMEIHNFGQTCNLPSEIVLQPQQQQQLANFEGLDLDISQYWDSTGSGNRMNSGSFEKYLNPDLDLTNNGRTGGSQSQGKNKTSSYSNVKQATPRKTGNVQLPIEEGRIDVNAWRSAELTSTSQEYVNGDANNPNMQNITLPPNNPPSQFQNGDPSLNVLLQDLYNPGYNNAPVADLRMNNSNNNNGNPGVVMATQLPVMGNNLGFDSRMGVGNSLDFNNQSRVSDASMQSAENSLNNLSREDCGTPRSKQTTVSHNNDFNNTLNIVAGASSHKSNKSHVYKDKNIECYPTRGSDNNSYSTNDRWSSPQMDKNPTKPKQLSSSQQAASQSRNRQSSSTLSSSSSSSKNKGRNKRHGLSGSSVADWVNANDGVGMSEDLLPPSMMIPQHEVPIQRSPQHSHHQHHHGHNYLQQQQLPLQQQQQQQEQHQLLQRKSCNIARMDLMDNNITTNNNPSLSNNIGAARNLIQNQLPQQLTTMSSPSSSSSSTNLYHNSQQQQQQRMNPSAALISRGTLPTANTAELPQSQYQTSSSSNPRRNKPSSSSSSRPNIASSNPHQNNRPTNTQNQNNNIPTSHHHPITQPNIPHSRGVVVGQEQSGAGAAGRTRSSPSLSVQTSSPIAATTLCSPGLASPMESVSIDPPPSYSSSGIIQDRELSSIGSSHSSMEFKRRWLESLGVDEDNDTPLHCMCDLQLSQDMLDTFRENKNFIEVINNMNNQQQTALFVAVVKQKPRVVRFLVEDADVNIVCKSDHKGYTRGDRIEFQTALHEAVESGNIEIAEILLTDDSTDVDSRRRGSQLTPLMLALRNHAPPVKDNIKMIAMLLTQRASLHIEDVEGTTPLMYMVKSGDVRLVLRVLKNQGVEASRGLVTATAKKHQMTCLHYAAALKDKDRKMELLKLLIQHGADPDKMNTDKQSPRHWASTEISMVMGQLKNKTVTDGASCSSGSPRNSPMYSPLYTPGGDDG